MPDPLRHNLFRFAPRELSHSAFWAWMVQAVDAERSPALDGPRAAATRLLRSLGVPPLRPPVTVETEVRLTAADRLDVRAVDAAGTVVVIENKVTAVPDPAQVARYRAGLGPGPSTHLVVLSTAFDADVRGALGCPCAGVGEILTALRPYRQTHFLLGEYVAWLEALSERREALARDALADEPVRHGPALATAEGQWALMRTLTAGMAGRRYRGVGLSGAPWTEFRFVEQTPDHDAVFYRVDQSAAGAHFQVRQYRDDVEGPAPPRQKVERLERLRAWWAQACTRTSPDLCWAVPRDRGAKSSVVGRLLFADNPPARLAARLPALHGSFVRRLVREGWPVTR